MEEPKKDFLGSQMKMAVRRVSRSIYSSEGQVGRVLLLAMFAQLTNGTKAEAMTVGTDSRSGRSFGIACSICILSGLGEVRTALFFILSGMREEHIDFWVTILSGRFVTADRVEEMDMIDAMCKANPDTRSNSGQTWTVFGCVLGTAMFLVICWLVRKVLSLQEQAVLNAHNLRRRENAFWNMLRCFGTSVLLRAIILNSCGA